MGGGSYEAGAFSCVRAGCYLRANRLIKRTSKRGFFDAGGGVLCFCCDPERFWKYVGR